MNNSITTLFLCQTKWSSFILILFFTFFSSGSVAQINTTNLESGVFQIAGAEISMGSYNSLSVGFDVKKAKAAIGFNHIQTSYSETDYEMVELYSALDYKLFHKNRLLISGGINLAFKLLAQQRFMNSTQRSTVNRLDVRPYIDISYKGQIVSPYLRGYRGLLNLETTDSEYFVNQQIAIGFKIQLDNQDDE